MSKFSALSSYCLACKFATFSSSQEFKGPKSKLSARRSTADITVGVCLEDWGRLNELSAHPTPYSKKNGKWKCRRQCPVVTPSTMTNPSKILDNLWWELRSVADLLKKFNSFALIDFFGKNYSLLRLLIFKSNLKQGILQCIVFDC